MNVESVTYFDSFGIKHIPKEIEKEHSLEIKVLQQIFIKYKRLIQ